jgi:hypothetical protein
MVHGQKGRQGESGSVWALEPGLCTWFVEPKLWVTLRPHGITQRLGSTRSRLDALLTRSALLGVPRPVLWDAAARQLHSLSLSLRRLRGCLQVHHVSRVHVGPHTHAAAGGRAASPRGAHGARLPLQSHRLAAAVCPTRCGQRVCRSASVAHPVNAVARARACLLNGGRGKPRPR